MARLHNGRDIIRNADNAAKDEEALDAALRADRMQYGSGVLPIWLQPLTLMGHPFLKEKQRNNQKDIGDIKRDDWIAHIKAKGGHAHADCEQGRPEYPGKKISKLLHGSLRYQFRDTSYTTQQIFAGPLRVTLKV